LNGRQDSLLRSSSNNTIELFGVFDGHGEDGGHASKNYIAAIQYMD
jgi:serine/threonine protein phosphatase PrpC